MAIMSVADERRTDTRSQIRGVALELFAEQGYDKTSLREIAERLGITKAAVYYHFKTKEEILTSLFDEVGAGIDGIVEWARAQPAGRATHREALRRYQQLYAGESAAQLIRFVQEGQATFKDLAVGADMKKRFGALIEVLTPKDGSTEDQLRFRLSLIAIHLGAFHTDGIDGSDDERGAAALAIAQDLIR
ncbi:TetR/AcrR family transcriptional regulator [Pseudonocardia sp. WMMC193]|uniref:TetR/AcrR family transcriptional regulator n=1 Tax=Pseudonocardia sp. WMMC193 TaxID=2911965 RepID=UPI001F1EDE26|nr:TetR/AcrR family transcriptional regulator [Pseudonocardia sp. WMMC193]MCF7548154.1 TetR/AcrR family transcriptional regulator [Pseudonocardia sp. WMMC193]